ncbi:MAG TPA: glycosyltransferase [Rhodanobacteraceae bacterium]|nr:glycosyltransferase [Rhodanobacteraceae bacterium]
MQAATTVIISPRDRYSGLDRCVRTLIARTPVPFDLWILDLGYPERVLAPVRRLLEGRAGARIVPLGRMIPMDALRAVREDVRTDTVVLLDNDSEVTQGWLAPLQAALQGPVTVASPLILERAGVDPGAPVRNHLSTAQLRAVEVDRRTYLIEHKHQRRALVSELPRQITPTGTFELHCVMFSTATFKAIELPSMVIREHLDISLQVMARGEQLAVVPDSVVVFDNLGTRMRLSDMRYFFYRWSPRLTRAASRLFERRWGYRFYSEQSMYNWVFRRKLFLLARWLWLPNGAANLVARAGKRLLRRDWDPLPDAEARSRPLQPSDLPRLPQASHAIR